MMRRKDEKIYKVGTLSYTSFGVFVLFSWMLGGGFCYHLMENLMPQLLPITLKQLNASNALIGLLAGSIPAAINMILCPIISFKSDRTRSRWGRRLPYILFTAPFVVLFLILTGFSPQIGAYLASCFGFLNPTQMALLCISIFSVGFVMFNMFVASVFYYLFADVVPAQFMGRFMAAFNLAGAAAAFVFARFVIRHAETHAGMIYTVISLIYLIAFTLVCLNVKEGEYPPLTEEEKNATVLESVKSYFTDCFCGKFYIFIFSATALNAVSVLCRNMFNVFFARENIGLNLAEYGIIMSYVGVSGIVVAFPFGWLSDKITPLRMNIIGIFLVVITNLYGFFLARDYTSFFVVSMLLGLVYAIQTISTIPMLVELFPKDKFGQFCSAQAMMRSVVLIVGNYGAGLFLDIMKNYRYLFIWDAFFTGIALIMMLYVYGIWKRKNNLKHSSPGIP